MKKYITRNSKGSIGIFKKLTLQDCNRIILLYLDILIPHYKEIAHIKYCNSFQFANYYKISTLYNTEASEISMPLYYMRITSLFTISLT